MKRAQGAVEFTLITTLMMLLFASSIIVSEERFLTVQKQREQATVDSMLDRIETEILLAFSAGDGYQRNFTLPFTLSGHSYRIEIRENQTLTGKDELFMVAFGKEHIRYLQVDVVGNLTKGRNLIIGGDRIFLAEVYTGSCWDTEVCHEFGTTICVEASDAATILAQYPEDWLGNC